MTPEEKEALRQSILRVLKPEPAYKPLDADERARLEFLLEYRKVVEWTEEDKGFVRDAIPRLYRELRESE